MWASSKTDFFQRGGAMQLVKAVAATLAVLAILFVLAIYGGSRWIVNNKEEIAKEVGSTIGLGAQAKRQCQQLEARYRREWDEAVDTDTIDRREGDFAALRQEIDQLCKAK
jgi:hypothetical protein